MQVLRADTGSATCPSAADDSRIRNQLIFANQVRVSGGYTHAPGLINQDTSRMVWARMCGLLGIPRCAFRRHRDKAEPGGKASAFGIPSALAGSVAGRVYAFLLQCAAASEDAPSNSCIGNFLGVGSENVIKPIARLETQGFITVERHAGVGRTITIVETGQVLRPGGAPRAPVAA